MAGYATALFADRHAAHAAVEQLVQAGFSRDAISVVMTEDTREREFGSPSSESSGPHPKHGVLMMIVTSLAPVQAEGVAIRVAGPLAGALLRAGDVGALRPALVAAGLAEPEARFLDEGVRRGSIAVGVHATGERLRLGMQLLALAGGRALHAA